MSDEKDTKYKNLADEYFEDDMTQELNELRPLQRSLMLCYEPKTGREYAVITNHETGETINVRWPYLRDTVFEWNNRLVKAEAEFLAEQENSN
jgi:hypothetical protein